MPEEATMTQPLDNAIERDFTLVHAVEPSIVMLTDALHALRHDRLHVTEEFLDRTIERLSKAMRDRRALIEASRASA
jgi:hypothetical protein